MHAFVTAGGVPTPDDPLYPLAQGKPKSLLDVAGKPMVQWVLDALGGSRSVERIVLVGVGPESGLSCSKPITFIPDQDGLLANVEAGVAGILHQDPGAGKILAVSSDIPAVTAEMVDWAVAVSAESDSDLYYLVIERVTMEKRFPEARRTFVRLKDAEVCGGDMNVMQAALVQNKAFWLRLVESRKSPVRQAALLGLGVLIPLIFHRLSLQQAERRISRRLNLRGKVILSPYAEIGMDADKPHQLEILRRDLARRGQAGA